MIDRNEPFTLIPDPRVIDAERNAQDEYTFDIQPEPQHQIGGWVHRAALGTLPTFSTLQSADAYIPKEAK